MRVSVTTSVARPTTISLDRLLHAATAVSVVSDPADAHRPWRSTQAYQGEHFFDPAVGDRPLPGGACPPNPHRPARSSTPSDWTATRSAPYWSPPASASQASTRWSRCWPSTACGSPRPSLPTSRSPPRPSRRRPHRPPCRPAGRDRQADRPARPAHPPPRVHHCQFRHYQFRRRGSAARRAGGGFPRRSAHHHALRRGQGLSGPSRHLQSPPTSPEHPADLALWAPGPSCWRPQPAATEDAEPRLGAGGARAS